MPDDVIRSRDNPRVKRWARLSRDAAMRRRERSAMVEGPRLVAEALAAQVKALALIVSEAGLRNDEVRRLIARRDAVVLSDRVFSSITGVETPPGIAVEIAIPERRADAARASVFLQGVQDPSNVGAILRSAAAFGVGEVVLDRGCADPWSPKVLRAAMGGHFKLAVRQTMELLDELRGFAGTTVCTVSHGGTPLRRCRLDGRLGWIFGAEGSGVSEAVALAAALKVSIPMAPGNESLNVAAAAAICLYEGFSKLAGESAARARSS